MVDVSNQRPVVLAAGGTGGHIFPAEALAEELMRQGERVVLVTDKRFANFTHGVFTKVETHTIVCGTGGRGLWPKISGAAKVLRGILQARALLVKLNPKAVVGFGGYPSFPTVYAASNLNIPSIIHEQNSVLGKANRLLAPRVGVIATSFPETTRVEAKDQDKVVLVGNPVRSGIRALHDVPYPELMSDGKIHLLVTGGSQGASIFGQIVPAAVAALPANIRARIRIDQQCRSEDIEIVRAAYDQLGISVDLAPFFVDLPARLGISHLVIARAGASTVMELAVAGRPGVLVPLPYAADNHQYTNANAFEDAGGGWVMTQDGFTAAALAARLEGFLTNPQALQRAAAGARRFGKVNAARDLAAVVMAAARGEKTTATLPSGSGMPWREEAA